MVNSNVLKISAIFFLTRRPLIIPRTLTTTHILYKEGKKQNDPNFEKKSEIKRETIEKKERFRKGNYHNFLCKCEAGFNTFSEFLDHVKDFHKIENLNFSEILAKKNRSEWGIKFYWSLSCKCGNSFSSSLCNADLKINNEQIDLLKKYRLRCLRCRNYAKFDKENLLDEFLKERVKQKLIYSFYKKEFAPFKSEKDSKKELEGHIKELCEKCRLSPTGFCGDN